MEPTSEKKRRGRRGRRRPKPLYERSCPKYFGQGFDISTRDLRDIIETLEDLPRQMKVSKDVKATMDGALSEVLWDKDRSNYDKSLIFTICLRMMAADRDAALLELEAIRNAKPSCSNSKALQDLQIAEQAVLSRIDDTYKIRCEKPAGFGCNESIDVGFPN